MDARRLNSKLGFRHQLFLCDDLCDFDGLTEGMLTFTVPLDDFEAVDSVSLLEAELSTTTFPEMPDLLYSLLSGVLFWLVSNLY